MIRLFAASRFCLFTVNISDAKLSRLEVAPLDARRPATLSIASVIVERSVDVSSTDPLVSPAADVPSAALATDIAPPPDSVVLTERALPANRDTPLNVSVVSAKMMHKKEGKKFWKTVASVAGNQRKGKGTTYDEAINNAIRLCAQSVAKQMVQKVNAKGIK